MAGIFGLDHVRTQLPLDVPGQSDPEPDLAITERPWRNEKEKPTTALFVVEISDSSIYLDRRKAGIYARAGVADYWVVNVEKRRLEVFRRPVADAEQEFGFRYAEQFELDEKGTIAPLAAPDSKIQIKSLF